MYFTGLILPRPGGGEGGRGGGVRGQLVFAATAAIATKCCRSLASGQITHLHACSHTQPQKKTQSDVLQLRTQEPLLYLSLQ